MNTKNKNATMTAKSTHAYFKAVDGSARVVPFRELSACMTPGEHCYINDVRVTRDTLDRVVGYMLTEGMCVALHDVVGASDDE